MTVATLKIDAAENLARMYDSSFKVQSRHFIVNND